VAMLDAEVAREVIDRPDQIRVEGAGKSVEMIEQGNGVPIEEDAGVNCVAAADNQRPASYGAGARDSGQVLHHLEGVALRTCGLRELGRAQAGVAQLLPLALALHRRLQPGGEFTFDAVDDL